jgi:hypothetical protein
VSPAVMQDELDVARFPAPAAIDWSGLPAREVKQAEFRMVMGQPYVVASYSVPNDAASTKRDRLHQPYNINGQSSADSSVLHAPSSVVQPRFDTQALLQRLQDALPGAAVTESAVLEEYDDYYYSRQGQLSLPVLRVKFDDPAESWIYVDPVRGDVLSIIHKYSRVERWLYNGLHSLDFAFWYHKRPFWDVAVILLLCGGLATSLLGLYLGLRRLGRDIVSLYLRIRHSLPKEDAGHATH